MGGAQRDPAETIRRVGDEITTLLKSLTGQKPAELVRNRRKKYVEMGLKGLAA